MRKNNEKNKAKFKRDGGKVLCHHCMESNSFRLFSVGDLKNIDFECIMCGYSQIQHVGKPRKYKTK